MNNDWNSYFLDIYNQVSGKAVSCHCVDETGRISVTYTHSDFNDEDVRRRIRNYLVSRCQSIDNDKIVYSTYWCHSNHITLYFTKK